MLKSILVIYIKPWNQHRLSLNECKYRQWRNSTKNVQINAGDFYWISIAVLEADVYVGRSTITSFMRYSYSKLMCVTLTFHVWISQSNAFDSPLYLMEIVTLPYLLQFTRYSQKRWLFSKFDKNREGSEKMSVDFCRFLIIFERTKMCVENIRYM